MMVGITKLVGQDSDRYSGDFGKMMVSDGLTEELSSWKGQSSGTVRQCVWSTVLQSILYTYNMLLQHLELSLQNEMKHIILQNIFFFVQ